MGSRDLLILVLAALVTGVAWLLSIDVDRRTAHDAAIERMFTENLTADVESAFRLQGAFHTDGPWHDVAFSFPFLRVRFSGADAGDAGATPEGER